MVVSSGSGGSLHPARQDLAHGRSHLRWGSTLSSGGLNSHNGNFKPLPMIRARKLTVPLNTADPPVNAGHVFATECQFDRSIPTRAPRKTGAFLIARRIRRCS